MDAKTKLLIIAGGLLVALTGCAWLGGDAAAHREQPATPESPPPPEVVQADPASPTKPADEAELVSETVQGYIQRIDDIDRQTPRGPNVDERDLPTDRAVPADAQAARQRTGVPGGDPLLILRPSAHAADPVHSTTAPAGVKSDAIGTADAAASAPDSPEILPPALGSVSVRGMPSPATSAKVDQPASPHMNTPAIAAQAPTNLADFLKQWPGEGEEASFRRQLDLRIMRVIAGEYEEAREPLADVSNQQQEMAARFIESLVAIREAHDGDPSGAASRVLAELERLRESLTPVSELQIPAVAICREVAGYGQYRVIEPPVFRAGLANEFVVYCELRGFVSTKQDDGQYEMRLDLRTRILNSAGESVLDLRDNDLVDRCRHRRHDCFIPRLIRLPAALPAGEYVAKVTIVDKLGEKVAENRAAFRIVAGP